MTVGGVLTGVGVGPGDPDLLTLRAADVIRDADLVVYPTNTAGHSRARAIAARWLTGQAELAMPLPFSRDRAAANRVYDDTASHLRPLLARGDKVAVLCEGDPLFYGSFMYLMTRLADHARCAVVPGITAFTAASARARLPLVRLDAGLRVLTGGTRDSELRAALASNDAVVIMKPAAARPRLIEAIADAGRQADAVYLEDVGGADECVVHDISELSGPGPYFALFLVPSR